jgi:hypothetical protein
MPRMLPSSLLTIIGTLKHYMNTSEYDDETELTRYVWNHYQHLFSKLEQLGAKAAFAEEKASNAASPSMADLLRKRWGSTDEPEVVAALADGRDAFRNRVRERVVKENANEIDINRCPACHRIVRTPRARQCLWCSHSWHDAP